MSSGSQGSRRLLAGTIAGAAQLLLLGALLWSNSGERPTPVEPALAPLEVSLVPKPPAPPEPADAGGPIVIEAAAMPHVNAPVLTIARTADTSDILSESQLAGAARAGEGGGGGVCDLGRAVQQALRRDRLVQSAVADANRQGAAILLWNGDWVRSGGEEGKGLSAAREAVTWEVAFAPQTCRSQRMHGLVLLTLADGQTRFAIGSSEWRWSDLLGVRER